MDCAILSPAPSPDFPRFPKTSLIFPPPLTTPLDFPHINHLVTLTQFEESHTTKIPLFIAKNYEIEFIKIETKKYLITHPNW